MKRYFAFGDLHGHYLELMALYYQLLSDGLNPNVDALVFLGDHIDSGPDSRNVVGQLMEWQHRYPHWVFLLGNHEVMMLNARQAWVEGDAEGFNRWWTQGGEATWRSYLIPGEAEPPLERSPFADIDAEHVAWLAGLPLSFETKHFIFVHAGLRPPRALAENNPQDLIWIRDEFIRSRHDWGKRVIYGHTPVNEPLVMVNKIGLDTLPRNVGKLTVVELDDEHPEFDPRFRFQPAFQVTVRNPL
ncbi:MAG: metallophosphoesterase family protein [Thermomicrobiales bacterium]